MPTATPSAPPPHNTCRNRDRSGHAPTTESWTTKWKEAGLTSAFPVLEDQNPQRYHQPLDLKLVKQLKEAVTQYGPQEAFTISFVESIAGMNLIPVDWGNLARAALSGGQYLVWKTPWQEHSQDLARRNAAGSNPQWNSDMLMGMGPYVGRSEQLQYNPAVYLQIAASATKAWKTLQGSGDLQGQLSKVIRGSNEAYADFVARLMQTAGRIFGDADTAMPLIKQLAYEQANKWCKEAIRPWKAKDLST